MDDDDEQQQPQKATDNATVQRRIEEETFRLLLAYQMNNNNQVSPQSLSLIGSSIPLATATSLSVPSGGVVAVSSPSFPISNAFHSHEIPLETVSSMRNVANLRRAMELRLLQAQQERVIAAGVEQQRQQAQALLLRQHLLQVNSLQQQYHLPIYMDQQFRPVAPQFTMTYTNYGDMVSPNMSTHALSGSDFNQQNLLASNLGIAMLNAHIPGSASGLINAPNLPNNFVSLLHETGHNPMFPQQFLLGQGQDHCGDVSWSEQLPSIETREVASISSGRDGEKNKNEEEDCSKADEGRSDKKDNTNQVEVLHRSEKNLDAVKKETKNPPLGEPPRHGGRKRKVKEAPVSPSAAQIEKKENDEIKSSKKRTNLRKESSLAYRCIPSPYIGQQTQSFYVSSQDILDRIPPEASCIFYLYDRRINMDAHPHNTSFYSLLRSWVQDDPCRVIPENSNLLDFVHPSTDYRSRKSKRSRGTFAQRNNVSYFSVPSREVSMLEVLDSKGADEGEKQGNPEVIDLLTEHVQKAKKNRKRNCSERAAQFKVVLPKLRAMGIHVDDLFSEA